MFSKTLLSLAVLGCACGAAQANPLNLVLKPFPDIASTGIDVVYNGGSLQLSSLGLAATFENNGFPPAETIFGGIFSINIAVNNAGVASGGTLSITGAIPSIGLNGNHNLLTGSLVNFGFSTVGNGKLEFVFGSIGGDLGPQYTAQGTFIGVIMNNVTNFPGNFAASWNNLNLDINGNPVTGTGMAVADTGSVPAPGSALVLALGAFAMPRRRR